MLSDQVFKHISALACHMEDVWWFKKIFARKKDLLENWPNVYVVENVLIMETVQNPRPTDFTGNRFCLLITAMNKVFPSHQSILH